MQIQIQQFCLVKKGTDELKYGPDQLAVMGNGSGFMVKRSYVTEGQTCEVWFELTAEEREELSCVPFVNDKPFMMNVEAVKEVT